MFVTVIAMNEGHAGRWRARRFFPNGQDIVLEVLDQNEDPPDVKGTGDAAGRMVPDPRRIGRDSFEEMKADMNLKVLADGATQAGLSKAAFDQAKSSAERASAELTGAKIEIVRLTDENETLREQIKVLESKLGDTHEAPAAEEGAAKSGKGKGGK